MTPEQANAMEPEEYGAFVLYMERYAHEMTKASRR
jgi:hypothetical protein